MLEPIDEARFGVAIDILRKGFPARSRKFWERGLSKIIRFCGCKSVGQFLIVQGRPVGIILTPRDERVLSNGRTGPIINLSSWYIEPEFRQCAPMMMKTLLSNDDAIFTNLSPTPSVIKIMNWCGFQRLNKGISYVFLPYHSGIGGKVADVVEFRALLDRVLPVHINKMLARHVEFGAIAGAYLENNNWYPLLFSKTLVGGVPMARLLYCEDNSAMLRNLGAICRFLLKHGKVFLVLDIPLQGEVPGLQYDGAGKFALGESFENRTDYAGSELFLLNT